MIRRPWKPSFSGYLSSLNKKNSTIATAQKSSASLFPIKPRMILLRRLETGFLREYFVTGQETRKNPVSLVLMPKSRSCRNKMKTTERQRIWRERSCCSLSTKLQMRARQIGIWRGWRNCRHRLASVLRLRGWCLEFCYHSLSDRTIIYSVNYQLWTFSWLTP